MVLTKRVGALLKEARESRKLSIKDVERETNIMMRYIEALEAEDYSQFPGETYIIGFLKSYADFLNLDTENLLNMYRGLKIDQSSTPLKELTRPTGAFARIERRYVFMFLGVIMVGALTWLGFKFDFNRLEMPNLGAATPDYCSGPMVKSIMVPRSGLYPQSERFSIDSTLSLTIDGNELQLCFLKSIQESGQLPLGVFVVRSDEHDYSFTMKKHQNQLIDNTLPEFEFLQSKINIILEAISEKETQVQLSVESGEAQAVESEIRVTLQFVDTSYVEWESDGNFQAETIEKGELRLLEARDRLLIKIGNGGGVKVGREGELELAGPQGRIVKLVYKRIADPLEPSSYKIEEHKEVVQ